MNPLGNALLAAADAGALILLGPGAPDELPNAVQRRHVPGGVLIPLAEGARLADVSTPVVVAGGDADLYGNGLGDLLHAVRRNIGVTCLVADNGMSAPRLALAAGASFVAQATPDMEAAGLIREALAHPGFALVNIRHERGRVDAVSLEGTGILHRAPELESFESLVISQSPLFTTVSTTEWDDWERIIFYEPGGEEDYDDGPDDDGAGA